MSPDPRQTLGRHGEELAAEHLIRCGYEILERNYRTRWGELDIVARDRTTLAFCEVKTRRMRPGGPTPLEAVHREKCRRVRRMAQSWLAASARPFVPLLRFDAIAVTFDLDGRFVSLDHIEGAF